MEATTEAKSRSYSGQRRSGKVPAQKRYNSRKYRLVAFVYVLRAAVLPIALGAMGYGFYAGDKLIVGVGVGFLLLTALLTLIFWATANSVVCRLCRTPLLKHMKCSKKKDRKIPHFLGDRSLATALSLLFRQRAITCQYCGEKQVYFE